MKIVASPQARVGIVVARFNDNITDELLKSALNILKECRVKEKNITIVSISGSAEIPFALMRLAKQKKFDCLVALGCIIRGETAHFDYVCKMAQEGILRVSLDTNVPVGYGVLTVGNLEQAQARFHLGAEAVLAALELARVR